MLFNSQLFLLAFLPLTLVAYYVLSSSRAQREWLLIAASIIYYGYWDTLHYTVDIADKLVHLIARGARGKSAPHGEYTVLE